MKNKSSKVINTSLSPKTLTEEDDIKKIQPYLTALKKALEDDTITNIALTGAYGSGKSTIINTFQDRNKEHEYINISLATFKEEITEGDNVENDEIKKVEKVNKIDDRLIELSILQQIFYHVNPSEIPDSRFKRIRSIDNKEIKLISLGFVIWVLSAVILFKYNFADKLNPQNWTYSFSTISFTAIISFIMFFIGIGIVVSKLIRYLNNSKISKVNFLKGELELGKDIDKSIFNEHLDEILYFFENTEYNVIVIEDLDRFKNTEVFTKLREINLLLNNAKTIQRKIKFIYAIRDDIFKDEERTKFFDYIVPVIPFINQASANEQLNRLINDAGLEHDFTDDFKDGVVTFIDEVDMRLLTNIFHEYTIYKECLGGNIIHENLFALMIYKNIYPKDFVDLSKDKGNLYELLKNKETYTKNFIAEIKKDIETIKIKINEIESEKEWTIKELRAVYINAIQGVIPEAIKIVLENKDYNFYELNDEDNFSSLIDQVNITYMYNSRYSNGVNYFREQVSDKSFSDIERLVNLNYSYQERLQLIIDKEHDKVEQLQVEIQSLENEIKETESWSLKKIFEKIDITPYLNSFSNSNLMRNLVLNGYIDENYNHYITLFHGINISRIDYDFERNVKSGLNSDYDFKLSKVKNLIKRIPLTFFNRKEILNYEVLAFLLNHKDENKEKLNAIISLLMSTKTGTQEAYDMYKFIKGYVFDFEIDEKEHKGFSNKNNNLFINKLSKWDDFWNSINFLSIPKVEKDNLLKLIMKFVDINTISKLNKKNNSISYYISQKEDFLSIYEDIDTQKVSDVLNELKIKIKKLTKPTNKNKELFDYIYENNHYEINTDNLLLILSEYDADFNESDFNTKNYTYLLNSNVKYTINYITENINIYVKNILLNLSENNFEEENNLINLYNNKDIKFEIKKKLIEKQKTLISDLSDIENEDILPHFIVNNKIKNEWDNIITYFEYTSNKLDDTLIDYLNQENIYNELSKNIIDEDNYEEDFIQSFSLSLIKCNKISYKSYTSVLKSIPSSNNKWETLNFESLDNDKVNFLIDNEFLTLSSNNYEKLKEHFDLHISLLEKHRFLFVVKFDDFEIDDEDLLLVLKSDVFSTTNKLEIIEKLEDSVIIDNEEIGEIVCNLLANSEYVDISFEIIESLFTHSASTEDKVKLLNLHFDELSKEEIIELLSFLPKNYQRVFELYGKPRFTNTLYNQEFVDNLLSNGYISSQKLKNDKIKVYAFHK